MAELRPYTPTWRDTVASWMMGQGQSSPERRAFVGGLLGSTGLGNTGVGVVDATPIGGLLSLQEASQAGDKTGMALASAGLIPGAGVAEKVAAKVAERGLSEELPALAPNVEHWARQLADNLANRAGDGYHAAHSHTPFGYSSYVKGPGGEFGPTVRISDHFANQANRPGQLMFGKDNFDEDAAWRHLTNNPSAEELDLIAQRIQAAEDMSAQKRIRAQQAYDAEFAASVDRGSKNPHKRAISVARQIKGDFSPAK